MTDTLTEFVNATNKTYAELTAGIPLVTTGAGERAVVKDVSVKFQTKAKAKLRVGNFEIASFDAKEALLAGSEIINPSSALSLLADDTAKVLYTGALTVQSSSGFRQRVIGASPGNVGTTPTTTSDGSSGGFNTGGNTPSMLCVAANGDVYYLPHLGAGSETLYRRAGGPFGAETSFASFGRVGAFDGRYIYGIRAGGTSIKILDTQTATVVQTTTMTGLATPGDNTAIAAAIDGYLCYRSQYNTTLVGVDLSGQPASASAFSIGSYSAGSSSSVRGGLAMAKNSAGKVVIFAGEYISGVQGYSVYLQTGSSFSSGQVVAKVNSISTDAQTLGAADTSGYHANRLMRTPVPRYVMCFNNTDMFVLDADNYTVVTNKFTGGAGAQSNYQYLPLFTPAYADEDFGPVSVRATGILTT
jgi:hypothetical protein